MRLKINAEKPVKKEGERKEACTCMAAYTTGNYPIHPVQFTKLISIKRGWSILVMS